MSVESEDRPLTPAELRALACVLDEVLPARADGGLPGAGEVGLAPLLDAVLGETPGMRAEVIRGIAALEELARARGAACLADLPAPRRAEVVAESEAAGGALRGTLFFPTMIAYYQQPRVLAGLGIEPRPPFPGGYELAPFDESLLEPVRRRGKIYRRC